MRFEEITPDCIGLGFPEDVGVTGLVGISDKSTGQSSSNSGVIIIGTSGTSSGSIGSIPSAKSGVVEYFSGRYSASD
jgi:hypothetical protein